jgi:hypothetical protein
MPRVGPEIHSSIRELFIAKLLSSFRARPGVSGRLPDRRVIVIPVLLLMFGKLSGVMYFSAWVVFFIDAILLSADDSNQVTRAAYAGCPALTPEVLQVLGGMSNRTEAAALVVQCGLVTSYVAHTHPRSNEG